MGQVRRSPMKTPPSEPLLLCKTWIIVPHHFLGAPERGSKPPSQLALILHLNFQLNKTLLLGTMKLQLGPHRWEQYREKAQ